MMAVIFNELFFVFTAFIFLFANGVLKNLV